MNLGWLVCLVRDHRARAYVFGEPEYEGQRCARGCGAVFVEGRWKKGRR